jgi:ribose-phosphate pyrophosphokinase
MKTLNLAYPENSGVKFRIDKFPDGQRQVVLMGIHQFKDGYPSLNLIKGEVQIKSRLNNFQDLELIICATKSLRNLGVKEIHLYTPYFLGSRSDRQFEEGSNSYLKDVVCPIINSLNFESVTVLDPHSDVLEACLNNFKKESNLKLVQFALINNYTSSKAQDNIILISPDAGASKKIHKLTEQIGYKGDIITCSKDRDVDGNLTKCVVPLKDADRKDIIIIDDICDGGATFINIAKQIKSVRGSSNKIYLIVTHGIFSKGFEELNKYFDGIYCTNSYLDYSTMKFNTPAEEEYIKEQIAKLKQLNVF